MIKFSFESHVCGPSVRTEASSFANRVQISLESLFFGSERLFPSNFPWNFPSKPPQKRCAALLQGDTFHNPIALSSFSVTNGHSARQVQVWHGGEGQRLPSLRFRDRQRRDAHASNAWEGLSVNAKDWKKLHIYSRRWSQRPCKSIWLTCATQLYVITQTAYIVSST